MQSIYTHRTSYTHQESTAWEVKSLELEHYNTLGLRGWATVIQKATKKE